MKLSATISSSLSLSFFLSFLFPSSWSKSLWYIKPNNQLDAAQDVALIVPLRLDSKTTDLSKTYRTLQNIANIYLFCNSKLLTYPTEVNFRIDIQVNFISHYDITFYLYYYLRTIFDLQSSKIRSKWFQ